MAARKPMKYWQTMLFAATALVVMAIAATFAAIKANNAIAEVTERQVIDLAEENTTRDALHIQSMVIGGNSVIGRDASHTMHMYADGSMVMESDSDAGSDTGSVTSMEAGHTMTNGAEGSMAMGGDGSVKLVASDSDA